jgi:hypothetical protein
MYKVPVARGYQEEPAQKRPCFRPAILLITYRQGNNQAAGDFSRGKGFGHPAFERQSEIAAPVPAKGETNRLLYRFQVVIMDMKIKDIPSGQGEIPDRRC